MENNNKLNKKYGLLTAMCMVVGIVIGSGVFFKASKVLTNNNGIMLNCLLTVLIVGLIMMVCSYVFSILARRHAKVNGIVDYAEVACGPFYAYCMGWFMTTIYYPTLTSCLAWISAQYTCVLFGLEICSDLHLVIAGFYLVASFTLNALAPKIAGKFQVSTTIIKLVPLLFMGVVGLVAGLINGSTISAMATLTPIGSSSGGGLMSAIVAFAFAYEGWIIATCINAELKDSKKNLPKALVFGAVIVIAVYLLYFVGLTGALSTGEIMASSDIPKDAFSALLGSPAFGTIAYVFVIISCLGTMNGLMLGCCRGAYSIAARNLGASPEIFAQVDSRTNMPVNSSIVGLMLCFLWLLQWQFGSVVNNLLPDLIGWENDELPIITLYAAYIPIFISLMVKGKDLNVFKRFIMPIIACIACVFMVYCAFASYKIQAVYYLIVFAVIMALGLPFYNWKGKKNNFEIEQKIENKENLEKEVEIVENKEAIENK